MASGGKGGKVFKCRDQGLHTLKWIKGKEMKCNEDQGRKGISKGIKWPCINKSEKGKLWLTQKGITKSETLDLVFFLGGGCIFLLARVLKEGGCKKDREEAAETMCSAVGNYSRKLAEGAGEENRSTDRLIIIIFSMVVGIAIIINRRQYYCRHGDGRKEEREGSVRSGPIG